MTRYKIEYENDTGPNDEGFWEWWAIYDGSAKVCECPSEAMAARVMLALEAADTSPAPQEPLQPIAHQDASGQVITHWTGWVDQR